MSSGFFGSADLVANTDTLIYTVPAGVVTTLNIRFANRSASGAQVSLAIGTGVNPTTKDYLTYDIPLIGNGIVEDTGLVLSAGEKVWVRSTATGVSVRAHGMEN